MLFFHVPNQSKTRRRSRARARSIAPCTSVKSNCPSSGSTRSQYTGSMTVFRCIRWHFASAPSSTARSDAVELPSSPPSARNGLPSTYNCLTRPTCRNCGIELSCILISGEHPTGPHTSTTTSAAQIMREGELMANRIAVVASVFMCVATAMAQTQPFDDHQNMMAQLGIKALRPGPNPRDQSTFDEANANPCADTMPEVLKMKDGTKVTTAAQWPARRAEILEDFEREVYGRIPPNVPPVTWEVTAPTRGASGGVPTITRTLVGHVDNSAYPQLSVNIQASVTVPD